MSERRLALAALDGHMQMNETIYDRQRHVESLSGRDRIHGEIVEERAHLVELGDEPEFRIGASVDIVRRNKAEYALVAEARRIVDVTLVLPALLVRRVKSLDGHVLASPFAFVDFAKAALAYARIVELDLTRDSALHTLRKAGAGARARPLVFLETGRLQTCARASTSESRRVGGGRQW